MILTAPILLMGRVNFLDSFKNRIKFIDGSIIYLIHNLDSVKVKKRLPQSHPPKKNNQHFTVCKRRIGLSIYYYMHLFEEAVPISNNNPEYSIK